MREGTFFCIDAHTCGNPVRLVAGGYPSLNGKTMSEKRQDFLEHHDWIRRALMFEPRGHSMMSGSILYPPCSDNADASVLFIETSGCLPMCGHGTIGTVTSAIEHGVIQPKNPGTLILDVPAGQIRIEYQQNGNKVEKVRIFNIASYLAHRDVVIEVEGLGELTVDVSYGGNYYTIIEPQKNFPGLEHFTADQVLHYSPKVRDAINQVVDCVHPDDPTVRGASHVLWTGTPTQPGAHARNAVFYGDRAIDRSPCGTGTSARMAQWVARGRLGVGDDFVHESIIGSLFEGRVESLTKVGDYDAIMPSIQGWARVTGHNTIWVDSEDPYAYGFEVK
ncbi:4-hydroxyproline epimerase [Photobacterium ganghwense]|uniref:Hydroxyproline-2-epimerase n=1 Tax=Photobacterium ganghwense TaxID=320778 RepID=A0A0J1H9H3_9GAMM|nr:4-hydroxyproline epimerase [Photobacterium ganghwense]KLV08344.1 hydroxyproline-2-epimerase [Photobacterium ganghwense]MBV1841075.1 4-hydroxyproline epimerase [Photobacterium ganghwense]PSU07479.1 4-hydroxyproline epimerase [Photobacterium ganghwense]